MNTPDERTQRYRLWRDRYQALHAQDPATRTPKAELDAFIKAQPWYGYEPEKTLK